ncbi:MAG: hypothetical protein GY713_16995 [Actinomycetia bacterium]|nr:hypothetical protein [Actinomycetes bacterium]
MSQALRPERAWSSRVDFEEQHSPEGTGPDGWQGEVDEYGVLHRGEQTEFVTVGFAGPLDGGTRGRGVKAHLRSEFGHVEVCVEGYLGL